MTIRLQRLRAAGALVSVAALLLVASCSEPAPSQEDIAVERVVYSVRGQITQLPSDDSPASEFRVYHEPIPEFLATWPDGPAGMNSMDMPFAIGDGVSIAGYERGQIVRLEFEVEYDATSGAIRDYAVTNLELLDPSTELVFGKVEERSKADDAASP